MSTKQFSIRNSLLTDLFEINHIKTIYNIFVAFLLIFFTRTVVHDLLDEYSFNVNLRLIQYSLAKIDLVIHAWICLFLSLTLFFYPVFHYWAGRKSRINRTDVLYGGFYLLFLIFLFVWPVRFVLSNELPNMSSFVLLCEQIRLVMKLHSFVRENVPKIIQQRKLVSDVETSTRSNPCPPFSNFLYFLFAPTLLYRDSYPMTEKIRWNEVIKGCLQIIGCLFCVNYIFMHFCIPEFQHFSNKNVTLRAFLSAWFNSILPASLCFLTMFFLILHSWHNVWAELLRFGDRLFYQDWWNAHNLSTYYKKWNIIVHDWLHAYVYQDINLIFGPGARDWSVVAVFCLSAIFHEYLIIFSFRFIYPVLFTQFFGFSLPLLFLTRSSRGRLSNVFFWICIFSGTGLSFSLYAIEWYARTNCQPTYHHKLDYLVPRSWYCRDDSSRSGSDSG